MSDCSTSAMKPKEVHCGNMKECVEMGVVVPDECFRYCHGGDSDAVRFERLAQVAREMYESMEKSYNWRKPIRFEELHAVLCDLESLGVSVDDVG